MRRVIREENGQNLVEFAIVILVVMTVIFGVFETARMMMTYSTLAEAARAGARYAAVHGADCTGACAGTTVESVVEGVASAAGISSLSAGCSPVSVCVSYSHYPAGATTPVPGTWVTVTVDYTFNPVTPALFFKLGVPLSSTTQAMVAY